MPQFGLREIVFACGMAAGLESDQVPTLPEAPSAFQHEELQSDRTPALQEAGNNLREKAQKAFWDCMDQQRAEEALTLQIPQWKVDLTREDTNACWEVSHPSDSSQDRSST